MTESIKLPLYQVFLYLVIGGIISYGYYALLYKTLEIMKNYQKKGLFLFTTTLIRLGLFILLSLFLTQCHVARFIWYILGFMIVRLFAIHHIKRGKVHG